MLVASAKTMDSLTPEEREAVIQEAHAVTPSQRKAAAESDVVFLEKIKSSGIQVAELTEEQRDQFRGAMTGLVHQFMDDIGADVVKMAAEDLGITLPKDESIVVAINADLTGKSAIAGQAIARGVTLAVNEINRSGGIDGKKIRVREMDHQAVAARSSEHMDKIMTQENVRVVFGGLQSAIIIGDLPKIAEFAKSDKVFISSWATAEAIINNRLKPNPVFRVSAHDKLVAPFLARQAVKRGKKVALLLENSAWGRGNHEELVKALKNSGVRPKREEFFNADQKEFVTELKAIEDSGADVLLMAANPAEAKEIVKAMIARPRKIPIIAHWGFTGGTFGADLAEELKSVDLSFLQTNAFVGNTRPLAAKVAAEYLASYGGEEPIDILAAAGVARAYDAMRLAGIALEEQAKKPKLTLIKAMEDITGYEGVVASYKYPFTGQREALDTTVYRLGRYDGSGRIVPLERQK
jgi:ABC-type branched-subunit amino acid transport system substrate-binding protein